MKIRVGVDDERSRLGRLTVSDAAGTARPVDVCATASPAATPAAGNASADPGAAAGHAPFGTYSLKNVRPLTGAASTDLGDQALVFEPMSGPARLAESLGRLELLLHAGPPGGDGLLRTTSAGLRVWPDTLARLAAAATRGEGIELEIYAAPLSLWDRIRYCRRRYSGFRVGTSTTDDPDYRRDDDAWSSSSREDAFSGKGGQFGGAGASGSWDAPVSPGAAMAAGAVAGAAGIAAASAAGSESDSPSSDGGVTSDGGSSSSSGWTGKGDTGSDSGGTGY